MLAGVGREAAGSGHEAQEAGAERVGVGRAARIAAVLTGVAQAADHAEPVGEVELEFAEGRAAAGGLVGGDQNFSVEQAGQEARAVGLDPVPAVVAARHPFQPAGLAAQAQLLAELADLVVLVELGVCGRGRVGVGVEAALEVDVAGDRSQLGPAEIVVDVEGGVEAVDLQRRGVVPVAGEGVGGEVGVTVLIDAVGGGAVVGAAAGVAGDRDGAEELADADGGAVVLALDLQANGGRVVRGPQGLDPAQEDVLVAQMLVGGAAIPIAFILLDRLGREPQGEGVGDGQVDEALGLEGLVVPIAGGDFPFGPGEGGGGGDDVQRPGGGVAAIEGALRTLEHLDPLQVVEVEVHLREGGQEDVVHIDAHRGVVGGGEVVQPHAAHGDDGLGAGDVVLNIDVGNQVGQVAGGRGAGLAQRLAGDGVDLQAHIQQVLALLLGGDDHLLDLSAGGGGRGGAGGLIGEGGEGERQDRQGGAGQEGGACGSGPANLGHSLSSPSVARLSQAD